MRSNNSTIRRGTLSRTERRYPLDFFPEHLDSRAQTRESVKFINSKYVIATYKGTGTQIIANFWTKENEKIVNNHPSLCRNIDFPWILTCHDDGMIQIYNILQLNTHKFVDTELSGVGKTKAQAVLFDENRILLVCPQRIRIWKWDGARKTTFEKEIPLNGNLHGIQQRFCHLQYPMVVISSSDRFQMWNVEANELIADINNDSPTATFLHVRFVANTIVAFTSESVLYCDIQTGDSQIFGQDHIITAVHSDSKRLITGDKNGLISTRNVKTGLKLQDINAVEQSKNMDRRINDVKFQKNKDDNFFVFAGHEDGKLTCWDYNDNKQTDPLEMHTVGGAIKEIALDEREVFALIKTNDPQPVFCVTSWPIKLAPRSQTNRNWTDQELIMQCLYGAPVRSPSRSNLDNSLRTSDAPPANLGVAQNASTPEKNAEFQSGCFGISLQTQINQEGGQGVPNIVRKMVKYLTKIAPTTRNIFKTPFNNTHLGQLKTAVDEGQDVNFDEWGPHLVGELLKLYLKELPEPLLTFYMYDNFVEAAGFAEKKRVARFEELFEELPHENKLVCKILFGLLMQVAQNRDQTMMTISSLGLAFGAIMLRPIQETNLTALNEPAIAAVGRGLLELIGTPILELHRREKETEAQAKDILNQQNWRSPQQERPPEEVKWTESPLQQKKQPKPNDTGISELLGLLNVEAPGRIQINPLDKTSYYRPLREG